MALKSCRGEADAWGITIAFASSRLLAGGFYFVFAGEVKHSMANMKNIEMKIEQVNEVAEKIQKASSVVVFDYRGLSVAEDTALRAEMRKQGVEYMVIKNHIVAKALKKLDLGEGMEGMLLGPSSFAFGYEDAVAPAKVLKDCVKKLKKCEIKGGLVEGTVTSAKDMEAIADLPSREVLIARMLGSMLSPVSGLAIVLDQIAKKQAEA